MGVKIARINDFILKNKDKLIWIVKLAISVFALLFMFARISENSGLQKITSSFHLLGYNSMLLFLIAFILVVPNWLIEGIKWRYLLKNIEDTTLLNALKSILVGLSVSMLTPNRIGEIPGRTLMLSPGNKKRGLSAATLGGLSQALVTYIFGIPALGIMVFYFNTFSILNAFRFNRGILLFPAFAVMCASLFYLRKPIMASKHLRFLFAEFKKYASTDLAKLMGWSVLRYAIFTTQFYLFLKIYGVDTHLLEGLLSIATTYLILYITPFLTIAEAGVRASAAIICIGCFSENTGGIVLAGFSIWLVNIALPATIGALALAREQHFQYKHKPLFKPVT